MSRSIRILFETLRSKAFGDVGANYTAIGTSLNNPIRILSFKNLTDATLLFSFDGVNDHDVLPAGGALVYDLSANKITDGGAFIAKSTTIYTKHTGVAPTSGNIYLSVAYGKGD